MKTSKRSSSIDYLRSIKNQINPKPAYQRSEVWNYKQKQLLISSILKGYDIPKIYMRELQDDPDYKYEIVDGQQRLLTIWQFMDNELTTISRLKYSELDPEQKNMVRNYDLDVVTIYEATDMEVSEFFYYINNGSPLRQAEIRNSMVSDFGKYIKNSVINNKEFFELLTIDDKHFAYDDLLAKMALFEVGGFVNLGTKNLFMIYKDYAQEFPDEYKNRIDAVITFIKLLFRGKKGIFTRTNLLDLYVLFSHYMLNNPEFNVDPKEFSEWFIQSEKVRKAEDGYRKLVFSGNYHKQNVQARFDLISAEFKKEFMVEDKE